MDDNYLKVLITAVGAFFSYCIYGIKRNSSRHDVHDNKISEHDKELAVVKEQMKHIVDKMDDILDMGDRLTKANNVILRTLTRGAKK